LLKPEIFLMNIAAWIGQAKDLGFAALSKASEAFGAGVGFVKSAVGQSWLFGSTETSSSYEQKRFDEKHYFLIPDRRSKVGYSLYVMRCLPEGVPPMNDRKRWAQAKLEAEDIRFSHLLRDLARNPSLIRAWIRH
jgi:hypothetical protein